MEDLASNILLPLVLYRSLALFVGLAFAYMGFKLFEISSSANSDFEASTGRLKILLKGAAPGSLFALFGMVLILVNFTNSFDIAIQESKPEPLYLQASEVFQPKVNVGVSGPGPNPADVVDQLDAADLFYSGVYDKQTKAQEMVELYFQGHPKRELRKQLSKYVAEIYDAWKASPGETAKKDLGTQLLSTAGKIPKQGEVPQPTDRFVSDVLQFIQTSRFNPDLKQELSGQLTETYQISEEVLRKLEQSYRESVTFRARSIEIQGYNGMPDELRALGEEPIRLAELTSGTDNRG